MRPILYPAAEQLIRNKKQQKLAERAEEEERIRRSSNKKKKELNSTKILKGLRFQLMYATNVGICTRKKKKGYARRA